MDPYYQQQQQQPQQPPPLHQTSQQQQRLDLMPSAPQMPLNQSSQQQHQHSQQQIFAEQRGQPIQSHQPSSHRQQQQHQQHALPLQQQQQSGYGPEATNLASQYPGQLPVGSSSHSRQLNGGGHTSSSHHHGSSQQATHNPQSSGHHSSSRYQGGGGGSSHRSAMMHQHRTSAAAISDPMMASTITDHLASASGPMTGSGSALNQLGYSGQVGGAPNYYSSRGDPNAAALYDQQMLSGQANYGPVPHQSRYDTHYTPRNTSGRHTSAGFGPGTTTAGAYHLDRSDLGVMANDPLMRSGIDGRGVGVGGSYSGAMHQSLGNLPSATSSRLAALEQQQQQRAYALDSGLGMSSHQHSGMAGQERYFGGGLEGRSGSMPPGVEGLGSYNPLDDPLATHQLHSRGFQPGADMQFSGTTGPSYGANPHIGSNTGNRDVYVTELRARLQEAQNSYVAVKRELETATQKLGSSMHSIKSFWSPELKKERALRKEEATKYALINDQMKLMRVEVQVS